MDFDQLSDQRNRHYSPYFLAFENLRGALVFVRQRRPVPRLLDALRHRANLTEMILLRAGEGFIGGVMISMAFTVLLQYLPKSKQPIGFALFGMTATLAPAIGPTIGGFLTDSFGWPMVFYVNLRSRVSHATRDHLRD